MQNECATVTLPDYGFSRPLDINYSGDSRLPNLSEMHTKNVAGGGRK